MSHNDGLFEQADAAATPLAHEERAGLIPSWVTFRHELNEVEQANLARGSLWAFRQRRREIADEQFLLDLHKRMLGQVWRRAGSFRVTERNPGVEPWRIRPELRLLLEDAKFWIQESVYPVDEIAVRFHHRLISIHPFANGNGRHARLAADLLVTRLGSERFTWGRVTLTLSGEMRSQYISALRAADRHEIAGLVEFARS